MIITKDFPIAEGCEKLDYNVISKQPKRSESQMNGILLIDKPTGWSSFDVVNKIRRIIAADLNKKPKNVKVGHTGTLDPLASGLLVLVVGDYCKRAQEFSKLDKTYAVTMRLGLTSTTGDDEGSKTVISDRIPAYEEIEDTCKRFVGEIMQSPPAFSAVKINGQRAYKLARAGKLVSIEPRPINIHSISLTDYTYPDVSFTAHVGSGTYIRSLVDEIGESLSTGAYMSDLKRITVGAWDISNALAMENVTINLLTQYLLTP